MTSFETPTTADSLAAAWRGLRVLDRHGVDLSLHGTLLLLYIARHAPRPVAMADLAEVIGVSGAAISRNIARLGPGRRGHPAHGLVRAFEDPDMRRRKKVALTAKGRRIVAEMGEAMASGDSGDDHASPTT